MAPCNCKICLSGLDQFTNDLAQIEPIETIAQMLRQEHSLDVNSFVVKRHFQTLGIDFITAKAKAPLLTVEAPLEETFHEHVDLNEITLERWGLNKSDPVGVVTFIQEKLLALSLCQMEIVASQQMQYLEGRRFTEPSRESISNLRMLLSLADKFTAISLHANQQKALQVVQNLGYLDEGLSHTGSLPASAKETEAD